MCLIAHRPSKPGVHVPPEVVRYNRTINPDGFGLAWRESNGAVSTIKYGPAHFDAFASRLHKLDSDPTIEYVAHWRKATHGAPCQELSHPFTYKDPKGNPVIVFHNGVIYNLKVKGSKQSDTSVFVSSILSKLPSRWWRRPHLRYLVEEAIGVSRLLVMDANETDMLNKSLWKRIDGVDYSVSPLPTWRPTPSSVTVGFNDVKYLPAPSPTSPKVADEITHAGHVVDLVSSETDESGDKYGVVHCDECQTDGEYYEIDGKLYMELAHDFNDDDDEAAYYAELFS